MSEPTSNARKDSWPGEPTEKQMERLNPVNETATTEAEREWDVAYYAAMQARDWQTCEILIEERETADWYVPDGAPIDVEAWGEVDH